MVDAVVLILRMPYAAVCRVDRRTDRAALTSFSGLSEVLRNAIKP
jgi:hypothetical protein